MKVLCRYFRLLQEKKMNDGKFFSPEQKLLYICTEENLFLLESLEGDEKKYFWAKEEELEFLEEILENWPKERINQHRQIIKGNWL